MFNVLLDKIARKKEGKCKLPTISPNIGLLKLIDQAYINVENRNLTFKVIIVA